MEGSRKLARGTCPSYLDLTVRREADVAVLSVRGELDSASAPALLAAVADLTCGGCHKVVASMTEVRFMDCGGLGFLIAASKLVREHEGWLRLAGVAGSPAKVMRLTGLMASFSIYDTVTEALAFP